MLRVVHPHFHPRRTGVTRHVEAVLRALATTPGIEASAWGASLEGDVRRWRLRDLWRHWRAPLVWHAHRNLELLFGLTLRLVRPRTRVVFTRHAARPLGRWTRWLLRRADARVALTEAGAEAMHPARVVGHGVELARFATPPEGRAPLPLPGARSQRHAIGVVGRVRPSKGQGDFVAALAPLLPRFPSWCGVVIGAARGRDAGFLADLRRQLPELLTVEEQLDIERWYAGLSILVQPSHSEGFSLVLLEAMASGCCVVAARQPHYDQLVEHGRTGFLYPPGDVARLRALLEPLLADPEKAHAIGRNAAREARACFDVAHEASRLAELYRTLGGQ